MLSVFNDQQLQNKTSAFYKSENEDGVNYTFMTANQLFLRWREQTVNQLFLRIYNIILPTDSGTYSNKYLS